MKKSKIIKFLCIIIIFCSLFYMYFIYNRAESQQVSAYLDESMYEVYSGKNVYEYYKTTLNDKEKVVYEELKEGYLQFEEEISIASVKSLTRKELSNAYMAVVLDHPEIFWMGSYGSSRTIFGNVNTKKVIQLRYYYNKEEAKAEKEKLAKTYDEIIEKAKTYKTDKEKVEYVHDELINISTYTTYDKSEKYKYQSMVSIFETGNSVCAGYAYSFKFIMDQLGIDSIMVQYVNDDVPEESHIWNKVKIEDEWLYLDITYDNTISKDTQTISHQYFLLDEESFYSNHKKPNILI